MLSEYRQRFGDFHTELHREDYLFRSGHKHSREVARIRGEHSDLFKSSAIAELRAGFSLGKRQAENEKALREFLLRDGVTPLFPDDQTTHHYAAVYRQLTRQGTPIPTNDMWIAALALQYNLALHSRDAHFDHLPQLVRV